jgi:UDP-GlcNAc:undecaprenyl-phosphate GlcNAc-1-phosphate transferase
MNDLIWLPLLIGGTLSAILTPLVIWIAKRAKIVDRAETAPERKRQRKPVPLLGGVALFVTFFIGILLLQNQLFGGYLLEKHVIGLLIAVGILTLGGALDDRFNLPAGFQILFPIISALTVIASGIGISYIDNPIGKDIDLSSWVIPLFTHHNLPYTITVFADLFTFVWLLLMTYTTKLLDGLDGLVSGLGVVGSLMLFFISVRPDVMQPETAILAALFGGVCLGFLLWNWHPARVYLGEGGSTMIGFVLGVLAIISGAKIATTLLIVGLPLIDHIIVVARRALKGLNPFTRPDRTHLHQRLVDAGIRQPVAAAILILTSAIFGYASLILPRTYKGYAILGGVLVMLLLAIWQIMREWRRRSSSSRSSSS